MVYCDKTKVTIFKSLTFGAGPLGCDICIAFIPFEIWKSKLNVNNKITTALYEAAF